MSASSSPSSGSSRVASPPMTSTSTFSCSTVWRKLRTLEPYDSTAYTPPQRFASGIVKVPTPQNRSAATQSSSSSRPSRASCTSLSAWGVFTWKNEGALTPCSMPATVSRQKPRPSRISRPLSLRALPASAVITRTIDEAFTAVDRVFATALRGNGPGVVHKATSKSPERCEWRTPTRWMPKSSRPVR